MLTDRFNRVLQCLSRVQVQIIVCYRRFMALWQLASVMRRPRDINDRRNVSGPSYNLIPLSYRCLTNKALIAITLLESKSQSYSERVRRIGGAPHRQVGTSTKQCSANAGHAGHASDCHQSIHSYILLMHEFTSMLPGVSTFSMKRWLRTSCNMMVKVPTSALRVLLL